MILSGNRFNSFLFWLFSVIVEWSVKGKFVAVAKKNVLSILTSKLKERLRISLSFKSWVGDCDVNCSVKGNTKTLVCYAFIFICLFMRNAPLSSCFH